MTLTVTNIVAGPFSLTGGVDVLPYEFLVFTAEEIEVYSVDGAGIETIIPGSDYTVQINTNLLGQAQEGGTVTYDGQTGQSVLLRANPSFEQAQVFTLLGFRPPTLNEGFDRAALRDLRLAYDRINDPAAKGDPGGNVLAAGLFTQLFQLDLPEGTDLIQTVGHTILGVGPSSYAVTTERTGETAYRTQMRTGEWVELVTNGRVDITQVGARFGQDILAAYTSAAAAIKEINDGGRLVIPRVGGWFTSSDLLVQVSNIHVELFDDVRTTKTTKSCVFRFEAPDPAVPITNVGISCPGRRCKIDGNGAAVTGFTYAPGYAYTAVHFIYCDRPYARNIWAYNGLMGSLLFDRCGRPKAVDCDGSHAIYDNGVSINFYPSWLTYDEDDPSTWTNGEIIRCSAWANRGFGIVNYAAIGMVMDSCVVWDNGNDIPDYPGFGGGMSVEADYTNSEKANRDSRTTVIGMTMAANRNYSAFITAPGVTFIAPIFEGVKAPVVRPNADNLYGNDLYVSGTGSFRVTNGKIRDSAKHGIFALSNGTYTPSVEWDGSIERSGLSNINARGASRVIVSPRSVMDQALGSVAVNVDNSGGAGYSQDVGVVSIEGEIRRSYSLAVSIIHGGDVRVPSLTTRGNRTGVGAGTISRFTSCARVNVGKVVNYNDAATNKTAVAVEIEASCGPSSVDFAQGDASAVLVLNNAPQRPNEYGNTAEPDFVFRQFPAVNVGGGAAGGGTFNTRVFSLGPINRPGWTNNPAAGTVVLPAGKYRVIGRAPGYKVDGHVMYVWNYTDNVAVATGSSEVADSTATAQTSSVVDDIFTLAAPKTIGMQHYTQTANATDGLGKAVTGFQGNFAQLGFWRL